MQRLEVSGAVRPIYGSLGVKRLMRLKFRLCCYCEIWGYHFGYYGCHRLLRRDTDQSGTSSSKFRRNALPPSSTLKIKAVLNMPIIRTEICFRQSLSFGGSDHHHWQWQLHNYRSLPAITATGLPIWGQNYNPYTFIYRQMLKFRTL